MFDTYFKVNYRQLLPTNSSEDPNGDLEADLGIYEDVESRAQRDGGGGLGNFTCPVWLEDYLPTLSLRERLLGCATCMICGYLLGFGSFMRMKELFVGNPVPLVVNVTVGNILALMGTCFLSGPQSQIRRMFHVTRKIASVMYLGCISFTLLLLLLPRFPTKGLMLLILLVAQYAAITWYCLSYIPFGRDILRRLCRRLVSAPGDEES